MIITVFGASGAIGQFVVRQALAQGYSVRAYVRNPAKLAARHSNLQIIKGELNDYESIHAAVSGSDAVLSTLGAPLKFTYEGTPVLDGHLNNIKAMEAENIKRFVTLGTPSIRFNKDKASTLTIVPRIVAGVLFPKAKKEIRAVGRALIVSSLDWTLVRILAPQDSPFTGVTKISFGDNKISFGISREDIAAFMLRQVSDSTYVHSMPIIGS